MEPRMFPNARWFSNAVVAFGVALACEVAVGCASAPSRLPPGASAAPPDPRFPNAAEVISTTDEFTGQAAVLSRPVYVVAIPGERPFGGQVRLAFSMIADKTKSDTTYAIVVQYSAPDWLFISRGESLVFLVDGTPHALDGGGSSGAGGDTDVGSGRIAEQAMYIVKPDLLRTIAAGSSVKVRVRGTKGSVDRAFDDRTFSTL